MKGNRGSTNARACSVVVNWAKPKPFETPAWSCADEERARSVYDGDAGKEKTSMHCGTL